MNFIVLTVALPLLAAFLLHPLERASVVLARALGPLVLLLMLGMVLGVWQTQGGTPFSLAIGGFAPPLGINFYVDRLALLFAGLTPAFGLLFWPRDAHPGRTGEEALMLLAMASASGLALAGDLFNIYVFYELLAIASLGLITVEGTGRAYVASLRYLFISALGSVLALLGIILIYLQAGTVNLADLAHLAPTTLNNTSGLAAFVLLLLGFGVKGELFPVNFWVAEVYATAPVRLAALLAGLMSKLAVLIVLRLLLLVFPQPEAAQLLLILGVLGLVGGELAAWRAADLRRMLAFSSVGQLGLIFIACALPGDAGVMAALGVMLHHLVVKPALFSLAPAWGGSLARLRGVAGQAPWAAGAFTLLALSLIGVPPLPGFWAKLLVILPLAQTGTSLHGLALAAVLFATVLETSYLFRLITSLYGPADSAPPPAAHTRLDLAVLGLGVCALLAGVVALQPLGAGLRAISTQAADVRGYVTTVFPTEAKQP